MPATELHIAHTVGSPPGGGTGGIRQAAPLCRRGLLLVDLAAGRADVHAPRAELCPRGTWPPALRVPPRCHGGRGDPPRRLPRDAADPPAGGGHPLRARGVAA